MTDGGSSSRDGGSSNGGTRDAGTVGSNELALDQSGSRLKTKVARTGDGAVAFLGWHDTQLDIDCAFTTAPDGKLRCLPGLYPVSRTAGFYGDSSCTQPVVYSDSPCGQPPTSLGGLSYVQAADSAGCFATGASKIYAFGQPLTGNTVYIFGSNGCSEANPLPIGYTRTVWPLGREMPADAFAEATTSIE